MNSQNAKIGKIYPKSFSSFKQDSNMVKFSIFSNEETNSHEGNRDMKTLNNVSNDLKLWNK